MTDNEIKVKQSMQKTKEHTDNGGQENPGHNGENKAGTASKGAEVQETESVVVTVQPEEPMTESLPSMGIDTKGANQVSIIESGIPHAIEKTLGIWSGKLKKRGKVDTDQMIQDGIALLKAFVSETNMVINFAAKNVAERAIIIGGVCLGLKKLIKNGETPWEVWAEQNLPFIEKRNRQKYMRIAVRSDCHEFTHLGVDRLDMLCATTKDSQEIKPIHALLKEYEILNDTTSEVSTTEFKKKIDAVISHERLLRHDLEINFDLVMNGINIGLNFDKSMIKRLKDSKDSGDNPETLLENDILSECKGNSEEEEANKRFKDFNTVSSSLIKTIDYIIKGEGLIDKVDKDIFESLIKKLIELQEITGLTFEVVQ